MSHNKYTCPWSVPVAIFSSSRAYGPKTFILNINRLLIVLIRLLYDDTCSYLSITYLVFELMKVEMKIQYEFNNSF